MKRRLTPIAPVSSLAVLLTVLLTGCSAGPGVQGGYIGLAEARSIALQRADLSAADVRWEERGFDLDDGSPVYELEFRAKGYEYSCDVHAVTGAVLDYDIDRGD